MAKVRRIVCTNADGSRAFFGERIDISLLQEKEAARVENVQITREKDRIIQRSTEGRLRITAIFPAEIKPESAKAFSKIFHAEMDRIEQQAAVVKNRIEHGID